jgi:hypothetical protein
MRGEQDDSQLSITSIWGVMILSVITIVAFSLGILFAGRTNASLPRVALTISGADVSKSNGKTIQVSSPSGYFVQVCRRDRDEIRYRFSTRGAEYAVKVLDERGRCVVCANPYIDGHFEHRDSISVVPKFSVESGKGWN